MSDCVKCGDSGAKVLFTGGKNLGCFCFKCASSIDKSVSDGADSYPQYSDNMYTRELYHRLTRAPNTPWKGY